MKLEKFATEVCRVVVCRRTACVGPVQWTSRQANCVKQVSRGRQDKINMKLFFYNTAVLHQGSTGEHVAGVSRKARSLC